MPVLHTLEEIIYGPELNLSGNEMRVLLFIRHRYLRNANEEQIQSIGLKSIGKAEIMKATGLDRDQLKKLLKSLIKKEVILYCQSKNGSEWQKNSYVLHPRFFGTNFVYNGVKKPLRCISGGKKSYPHEKDSYPQEQKNEEPKEATWGLNQPPPGVEKDPSLGSKKADFELEDPAKPFSTTQSLNPFAAGRKKTEDTFGLSEEEIVEMNREKYRKQKAEQQKLGVVL